MELDAGFAYRVKWAVNQAESSFSAVARAMTPSVSPQAIQQWASGETKSPRKDHVEQAAKYLKVRFEWLAYGRGPSRGAVKETQDPHQMDASVVILAHEWEESLRAALPKRAHKHLYPKVPHPSGSAEITPGWVSNEFLADFGLYKGVALNLVQFARQKLWLLAVLRKALPLVADRRVVLVLSPLEQWRGSPEPQIEALRAEARVLGIELIHSVTPEHVAALLTGQESPLAAPTGFDLGLEISPVLQ